MLPHRQSAEQRSQPATDEFMPPRVPTNIYGQPVGMAISELCSGIRSIICHPPEKRCSAVAGKRFIRAAHGPARLAQGQALRSGRLKSLILRSQKNSCV